MNYLFGRIMVSIDQLACITIDIFPLQERMRYYIGIQYQIKKRRGWINQIITALRRPF